MADQNLRKCEPLFRSFDWAAHPLGSPSTWSKELRTVIETIFASPTGICLALGSEMFFVYNDAYTEILGRKHPSAMGRCFFDVYAEVEPILGEAFRAIYSNGSTVIENDYYAVLERPTPEECYFRFTGSPIKNHDGVSLGAMFVVVERSREVRSLRRSATLRELTECASLARSASIAAPTTSPIDRAHSVFVATSCLQVLKKVDKDLPFAALYLNPNHKDKTTNANLIGCCGDISPDTQQRLFPALVELNSPTSLDPWNLRALFRGDSTYHLVTELIPRFGVITLAPWTRPPTTAHVYTITGGAEHAILGAVVLGESPLRSAVDEDFMVFTRSIVNSLSSSLVTAMAVEEEQRRVAELEALNQAKSSFVASVSHELRTPLTLIISPLEDLLSLCSSSEQLLPPRIPELLSIMHRNAVRLLSLVNNLLEFSASETGYQAFGNAPSTHMTRALTAKFERMNIAQTTAEILSQFEHAAQASGLRLTFERSTEDLELYIDREMWEKIVVNLVSNAIKFTKGSARGEVIVCFEADKDNARFIVRDTGMGIAEEELSQIFKRFYRTKAQVYTEGTGIGLSLVKEFTLLHGGNVRVDSKPGQGACFTVELKRGSKHLNPLQIISSDRSSQTPSKFLKHMKLLHTSSSSSSASLPIPPPSPSPAPARRLARSTDRTHAVILIVDDAEQMLHYISSVLCSSKQMAYSLRFARNGREALESINREGKPDLLLSDVMMPEMDGISLLRHVRSNADLSDLPILLMSARGAEQSRLAGIGEGADDYLVKPFSSAELLTRVKSIIELVRARRLFALERDASITKDKFIAILSHELRNPLSPVLLIADTLIADEDLPNKVRDNARTIHRNVGVAAALIDDLLDCAQLACNSLSLKLSPAVDIHALLQESIFALHSEFEEKSLRVAQQLCSATPLCKTDSVRLLQLLGKLLKNAFHDARTGGTIKVSSVLRSISPPGTDSVVQIRIEDDNGAGIAPSYLPHVFQRFSSLLLFKENGLLREANSIYGRDALGTSMFLAHSLAQLMKGNLTIESAGEGRGTCVTLSLPCTVSASLPPSSSSNKRPRDDLPSIISLRGTRVLVVEDNPTTALIMRRIISNILLCDTTIAESMQQALGLARQQTFDILVSDIGLPDGNGWQLMEQLRSQQPSLVGIAVTGYSTDNDIRESHRVGFLKHLSKPITLALLKEALTEAKMKTSSKR